MHDTKINHIVIAIQGTSTVSQAITDMNGHHFPVLGGAAVS
jgi:hypothetical protein